MPYTKSKRYIYRKRRPGMYKKRVYKRKTYRRKRIFRPDKQAGYLTKYVGFPKRLNMKMYMHETIDLSQESNFAEHTYVVNSIYDFFQGDSKAQPRSLSDVSSIYNYYTVEKAVIMCKLVNEGTETAFVNFSLERDGEANQGASTDDKIRIECEKPGGQTRVIPSNKITINGAPSNYATAGPVGIASWSKSIVCRNWFHSIEDSTSMRPAIGADPTAKLYLKVTGWCNDSSMTFAHVTAHFNIVFYVSFMNYEIPNAPEEHA